MAEELFTDIINKLGKNLKKAKEEGKITGGYRFADDGKIKLGGGYYDDNKMFEVEIGKDSANVLFKKRFADGGSTSEYKQPELTKKVIELMEDGYDFGEAVKEAMRQGYVDGGGVKPFLNETDFIREFTEKRINGEMKASQFVEYLNENYSSSSQAKKGFTIDNLDRRLRKAQDKGLIPKDIVFKGSKLDLQLTPEKYISLLGEEEYNRIMKEDPTKLKYRYEYLRDKKNRPDFLKIRSDRTLKRMENLRKEGTYYEKIIKPALEYKQKKFPTKFTVYRDSPTSLAWKDLVSRTYQYDISQKKSKGTPYFKFETPIEPGKNYNTADMKKIVLVDKNGNRFTQDTLFDDVKKVAGEKEFKSFKNTYEQRAFMNKDGITTELNKLYGNKQGSYKSVFNIQHIEGFNKNPFKIHMTFATQNADENKFRRNFNRDFGKASKILLDGKGTRFAAQKKALNTYYKSLGPDIVAQIGKRPRGTAPLLTELLKGLRDTKGNTITSPIIQDAIKNLSKSQNDELNGLVKKQIATVKRYAAKNGIKLNSFAAVVDLSQSGLTMPPAVENALKTIVKYGGKTLRGIGRGALILDPIFVAADENRADRRGAGALDKTQYIGESFVQGLINLPTTIAGAGTFASDFLKGKRGEDLEFKSDILYTPKTFAEENLEQNLKETPIKKRARNLEFNMLSAGGYRDPKLADPEYQKLMESMSIEDTEDIIKKGDIKAKSYGIGTLPREVAKPTRYDIKAKKVYNN